MWDAATEEEDCRTFGTSVTQEHGQKQPRPLCKSLTASDSLNATNRNIFHLIYALVSLPPLSLCVLKKNLHCDENGFEEKKKRQDSANRHCILISLL